ncbi:MAG TPA: Rrf2 family transcriptional regulator [Candidatus Omnitrophota bacterium]|jgi:Rrf2 family protein|nr:Rrf2 family transcriptional regulator [Candidatus Omnitrophota bacterium]HSA31526.1 Rrf2 family transcriptional regulator [Candidatus Omnitrophota bacterium]
MFKINKKIGYALIALKHMSGKKPGQLTSAKEICDAYKVPFDPTARTLQIMTQHGILHAEQGAHGGYQIIKNLERVTLKDLNDILVGPLKITNCLTGKPLSCPSAENCSMISPLLALNERVSKFLDQILISSLIKAEAPTRSIGSSLQKELSCITER